MLTKVKESDCRSASVSDDERDVCRVYASELLGGDGMLVLEYRGAKYLLTNQHNPGELALIRL
jgi:hemin uptake protein HemP